MKRFALPLIVACFALVDCHADENMTSPDGKVAASVFVTQSGDLRYRVQFKNQQVVEPSVLGITVDGVDLGNGVMLGDPDTSVVDETYVTRGNHTQARNHYTVSKFPVHHNASGRKYSLEFRVYDDGVAYRYVVPAETRPSKTAQHVDGETSSWKMMDGAKVWYFERLAKGWKLKSYAGEWMSTDINHLETATPANVGPIQGTPLVFQLPGDLGYAAVTKAALYNYSGMRLKAVGNRTVVANFTEGDAGFDVHGTIVSPWRVTMLADDLNELVNSDLITNLNPAPDPELFADTGYIQPGRSVWSWETLGLDTPETQRTFIDLAAEMGFEYSMVDDGWKDWDAPWDTVRSLCDHGRNQGIGVWLWVHSHDIHDPSNDYQQLRDYFDRVTAVGAVGLKIDFMDSEAKEKIDFELAVLRNAAQRKLLINFHGCHASTGEERTYPNELTREGIRGIEVNKHKEGPLPASHNAALPFTRFVVGHGDYTPILYTSPGPTTWAHQLATLVAFTSPLQVYAEHPDAMMKAPVLKQAFPVMQSIPTVWDETIVLPHSRIGDVAAIARRSGDDWFVGVLNGAGARDYELDFGFLPAGTYEAVIVSDDLDAEPVELSRVGVNIKAKRKQWTTAVPFQVDRSSVDRSQKVKVPLAKGGGLVVQLIKQSN
ncbi:glycoside hydrolase family 97 protein [Novipirellula rosea]|uniref:Glycoside hydrolase family 97 protein n=1 Tax=Novipirellula rosea TaxID=1031540 RepID=A0ABP8M5X9_9BACT